MVNRNRKYQNRGEIGMPRTHEKRREKEHNQNTLLMYLGLQSNEKRPLSDKSSENANYWVSSFSNHAMNSLNLIALIKYLKMILKSTALFLPGQFKTKMSVNTIFFMLLLHSTS